MAATNSMMASVIYLLFFIHLTQRIHVVDARGEMIIKPTTFRDPDGLVRSKEKCNERSECNVKLEFCTSTERVLEMVCNGQFNETDVYRNQTNVNFANEQFVYAFSKWTGHVGLNIRICHDDNSTMDNCNIIDIHNKYYAISVTSVQSTFFEYSLVGKVSTLNITIETRCAQHYYGNSCSIVCNDGGKHYKCNPFDGSKKCRTGWTGTECDVVLAPTVKSGSWITSTTGGIVTLCVIVVVCLVLIALGTVYTVRQRTPRKVGNANEEEPENVAGKEENMAEETT